MNRSANQRVLLVGGGGHALVVAEAALASGWTITGFLDDNPQATLAPHAGRIGPVAMGTGHQDGARAHLAIGNLQARREILAQYGACPATIIHPRAWLSPTAEIGDGTFIGAAITIQGRTRIGGHCIINTGAIVEHDGAVGDNVHIAPRATLLGEVHVGPHTFIGAGAIILPGIRIGTGSVIGAGAVVTRDVPDGVTVVGVPARAL